jgi:cerevisin
MLLSHSVAYSILAALSVNGLVIPHIDGDTIDVFGNHGGKAVDQVKQGGAAALDRLKQGVSAAHDLGDSLKHTIAPLLTSPRDVIPHKYIVVLDDKLSTDEAAFHREWVSEQHANSLKDLPKDDPFMATVQSIGGIGGIADWFNIDGLLNGYSGHFTDAAIEIIRKNPHVKFVEQDSVVYASEFNVQKGAPWGLARVSHREPLSLNSFNQYLFDNDAGKGVTSYVIDTGINVKHKEFKGRATWGATIPQGDEDVDGNGHGTHCAGTIASETYGVAKGANVVAVKVLRSNGSGSMSDVVKGVEFAAKAHQKAVKENKKGFKGSTANMSLGGGKSPALDLAVNAAVTAGIHFAVAAGNENQDACNTSPASAEKAITVGASTISDARAYFSNYGKCVDIFAPGLNILSTYIGSDSATATLSGTSMASPHIAGLLSYYLSLQPGASSEFFVSSEGVSPQQLKKNLIAYGSKNLLTDVPEDTPNILAFNGAGHNISDFWGGKEVSSIDAEQTLKKVENKVHHLFQDLKDIGLGLI